MGQFVGIYKQKGPTSFDIVHSVRKITGERCVGHAGTLDPLARGILVIAIGRECTKKISEIVDKEKEYIADIYLGAISTTDDMEGEISIAEDVSLPPREAVEAVVKTFIGEIAQVPPVFSAIKIKGKKAYELARTGEAPSMEPRKVFIKHIEILEYNWPHLVLRVETGPGVYIRALARDIGERLGVGGYLADLERTRVGEYTVKNSMTIEQFKDYWKQKRIPPIANQ